MSELFDMIFVDANILATMVNLFIFAFALDFVLSFARCVMNIGIASRS